MAPRAQLPEEKPRATSKWKPKRKPKNCENVTTLPCQTALRSRPVVSARDRPSSRGCHSPRDPNATKPLPQARTPSNSRLKNKKIKNKKVLIAGPLRYRARSPLLASSIARAKERERFSKSLAVLALPWGNISLSKLAPKLPNDLPLFFKKGPSGHFFVLLIIVCPSRTLWNESKFSR